MNEFEASDVQDLTLDEILDDDCILERIDEAFGRGKRGACVDVAPMSTSEARRLFDDLSTRRDCIQQRLDEIDDCYAGYQRQLVYLAVTAELFQFVGQSIPDDDGTPVTLKNIWCGDDWCRDRAMFVQSDGVEWATSTEQALAFFRAGRLLDLDDEPQDATFGEWRAKLFR